MKEQRATQDNPHGGGAGEEEGGEGALQRAELETVNRSLEDRDHPKKDEEK